MDSKYKLTEIPQIKSENSDDVIEESHYFLEDNKNNKIAFIECQKFYDCGMSPGYYENSNESFLDEVVTLILNYYPISIPEDFTACRKLLFKKFRIVNQRATEDDYVEELADLGSTSNFDYNESEGLIDSSFSDENSESVISKKSNKNHSEEDSEEDFEDESEEESEAESDIEMKKNKHLGLPVRYFIDLTNLYVEVGFSQGDVYNKKLHRCQKLLKIESTIPYSIYLGDHYDYEIEKYFGDNPIRKDEKINMKILKSSIVLKKIIDKNLKKYEIIYNPLDEIYKLLMNYSRETEDLNNKLIKCKKEIDDKLKLIESNLKSYQKEIKKIFNIIKKLIYGCLN